MGLREMTYPTLEQYNEAFQAPQIALIDPELKRGTILTTGLGLPLALCGGFALTYTINSGAKKYAVRCFHKQSNALEKRYSSISNRLKNLKSHYFVDFEFQSSGVRVTGNTFPIVKMAWATGTTLGQFLEQNYKNAANLQNLSKSLRGLSSFLEQQGMAHGDIQPGNVMVADAGKTVQLIDYDGIYLDDLRSLGSAELGHRNFQHPKRAASSWDSTLDRFSFISIDLALRILSSSSDLWSKTQSDGDSILFKANDFADPAQSNIFNELLRKPQFSDDVKNFISICHSDFGKTPSLEDYLARKNIPQVAIAIAKPVASKPIQYLSAFPVLDAQNYGACLAFVGDKVELIGQIVEVKENKTRHGKPYVFINFGPWQGQIVKVSIWSEGLEALTKKPTQSWVGKWISVVGLMEPPYVSRRYKYSHLAISITQGSQLHVITEKDAKFRISSAQANTSRPAKSKNEEILKKLHGGTTSTTSRISSSSKSLPTAPRSKNEAILVNMKGAQRGSTQPVRSTRTYQNTPSKSNSNCFIATAIYGAHAPETVALRQWRDANLITNVFGRVLTQAYYATSPYVVSVLDKYPSLKMPVRNILNGLISIIGIANRTSDIGSK